MRPQLADADAADLEQLFQALADRHRLRIVNMLAQVDGQAICVCDFQDALGLKQPTVSYHLRQLVDAGVIDREQRGRFAFYSLGPARSTGSPHSSAPAPRSPGSSSAT